MMEATGGMDEAGRMSDSSDMTGEGMQADSSAMMQDSNAADTASGPDMEQSSFDTGFLPAQPMTRHHWIVRITHWSAFVLVFGMITSGLQIYRAYPRFGERGGPYYPNPFQDVSFPEWMRLGGWLAGGINWHFLLMWPLVGVGIAYLAFLIGSGEWRKLVFRPRDLRHAIEMQKYYLRLRKDHPPQGKHNALQKLAYTLILALGVLSVLSGVSLWKPVQLWWLTAAFGGFQSARYVHFVAVWLFVAFTVIHVVLVFAVDPASLRAMITGRYTGRFQSDEA